MRNGRKFSARAHLRLALSTACMAFTPYAARAQTVQAGVDVSLQAEAVSNPYLDDEDTTWVGAGTVEVRPWLRQTGARDSIQLRGLARVRGFTGAYDAETAFGADLSATSRISARTTAFANADILTTSRRTFLNVLTPRPGLADPIVPPETVVPIVDPTFVLPGEDVTVLGDPGRLTTATIGAGLAHQLDPNSRLTYSVGYRRTDGDRDSLGTGFDAASLSASYSRQLNPRTQLGLSGTASKVRYEENRPSVTTLSLSGTWAQQLGRYWSLNASAGVSRTEAEGNVFFPGYRSVTPIASFSLCNQPVKQKMCFGYSRTQQPSFLGDVRSSDAAFASYSEQLSQTRRFDLSASYARSDSDDEAGAQFSDVEAVSLRGVFTQTINDRTEGYISGSVARTYGGALSREPSIALGVGVRFRLGSTR